jgi:hypothetical protein
LTVSFAAALISRHQFAASCSKKSSAFPAKSALLLPRCRLRLRPWWIIFAYSGNRGYCADSPGRMLAGNFPICVHNAALHEWRVFRPELAKVTGKSVRWPQYVKWVASGMPSAPGLAHALRTIRYGEAPSVSRQTLTEGLTLSCGGPARHAAPKETGLAFPSADSEGGSRSETTFEPRIDRLPTIERKVKLVLLPSRLVRA